ncbi:MAG: PAS domain S-box protein [Rhodospirillaceae bacterium]|nr:PAS domain S-box protein [Rhodospirillaceae bacterium]
MDTSSRQKIAALEQRVRELEDKYESGAAGTDESRARPIDDHITKVERYELALHSIQEGVWDWDISAKKIWQSVPMRILFGESAEETISDFNGEDINDPLLQDIYPEDRLVVCHALSDHLLNSTPYHVTFRFRMPDRNIRWIRSTGQAIRSEDGTPIRMVGSDVDITDRVNADAALRASEARYEEAQRTAQVGSWEFNMATGELIWSAEVYRIFGTTPDAFQVTNKGFLNFVHPDDLEQIQAQIGEAHRSGDYVDYEHRIVLASGEVRWVHQVNSPDGGEAGGLSGRRRGTIQHITERKLAEQALKNSEAQQRLLMDSLPALIAYIDAEQRYRAANRVFEEWYQVSFSSVVGKTLEEVVGAENYEKIRHDVERALAGEHISYDRTITYAQGRVRDIRASLVPDFGPEREVRGYYVLITDITDRNRAERELRESEERYRSLIEDQPEFVSRYKPDGTLTFVNAAYAAQHSMRPDEMAGMNIFDFVPEGEQARVRRYIAKLGADKPFDSIENRAVMPDGTVVWQEWTDRAFVDDLGHVSEIQAFGRDVTQRKEIEEALRDREQMLGGIFDTAAVGIVVVDREGRFLQFNHAYQTMLGRSAEELKSMTFWDVTHPDDHVGEAITFDNFLAGDGYSYQIKKRYIHKDGSIVWVNVNSARKCNAEGETIGDIAIVEDITRRKEVEAQLIQSQKMEVVGQLTGGVAHDFNNLLTVISGSLHLLEGHTGADAAGDQLIERALRAVERGADLTQRLLAFSRTQTLRPNATDVAELVSGMIEILQRTLGANIEIVTSQPDALWLCEVDPSQLENAILNLAINARDAMPEGGSLAFDIENVEFGDEHSPAPADTKQGKYVVLSVSDSGLGMPEDVLKHVFEPFYTTKEVGKGSGLGLSMVYGFARQSGGHADIESDEGAGTCVRLYLPRAVATDAPSVDDKSVGDMALATGETILVVEDNPDVRTLAVALLSKADYQVVEAPDAEAALAVLRHSGRIDLLLSDVVLPGGMNGASLAVKMRAERPGIKIVLMSGHAESAFENERMSRLDFHFIQKPFGKPVLLNTIRKALGA